MNGDEKKRKDILSRCNRYIELVKKHQWHRQDESEYKQTKDILELIKLLESGKPFQFGTGDGSGIAETVGCDGSIYFVLLSSELDKLEIQPVMPVDYGHHHAKWRRQ